MAGMGHTMHDLAVVESVAIDDRDTAFPPPPREAEPEDLSALRRPLRWAAVAAFLWLALGAATVALILYYRAPASLDLLDWAALAAGVTAPLALIGVAALAWMRVSALARNEMTAHARLMVSEVAAGSRGDLAEVERMMVRIAAAMENERTHFAAERDAMMAAGDDLARRAADAAALIARQSEEVATRAALLDAAATSARTDLGVMLADLPLAETAARAMAATLNEETRAAHRRAEEINGRLAALRSESEAAATTADRAGEILAQRIASLAAMSDALETRLAEQAEAIDGTIGGAVQRAEAALEATRAGLVTQTDAMHALIAQGHDAIELAGTEATRGIADRLEQIGALAAAFGQQLDSQRGIMADMANGLETSIDVVAQRFTALSADGDQRAAALAQRLSAIRAEIEALTRPIIDSETHAGALIAQANELKLVLGDASAILSDTLPAGLSGTREALSAARADLADADVLLAGIDARQSDLIGKARQLSGSAASVDATITAQVEAMTARLAGIEAQAAALGQSLAALDRDSESIGLAASARLADMLGRVRDSASQAIENSRDSLDRIIEDTRVRLAQAVGDGLSDIVDGQVRDGIASLGTAAEAAVATAQSAAERLARQMLTIADTTAAIEARIAETNQQHEVVEKEDFARRSALLIESLNSLSIDISKVLSNEVPDTSWAAYLKGDRTVFTRRAVRLIDNSEVKTILRSYETEPEFRDSVNRYIHDFEAMIRRVMAEREGSPMAVTLLSSDTGKLYVALAQAIDRLRA